MTLGLSIKEVYKTWNPNSANPVSALQNINLDVSLGEFVVLLGPSGCGKSSLLYNQWCHSLRRLSSQGSPY